MISHKNHTSKVYANFNKVHITSSRTSIISSFTVLCYTSKIIRRSVWHVYKLFTCLCDEAGLLATMATFSRRIQLMPYFLDPDETELPGRTAPGMILMIWSVMSLLDLSSVLLLCLVVDKILHYCSLIFGVHLMAPAPRLSLAASWCIHLFIFWTPPFYSSWNLFNLPILQ